MQNCSLSKTISGAFCADTGTPRAQRRTEVSLQLTGVGHVWTVPAVQEESDYSAKRSGAVMYSACFRLEACLYGDATTMAAGRDVIR